MEKEFCEIQHLFPIHHPKSERFSQTMTDAFFVHHFRQKREEDNKETIEHKHEKQKVPGRGIKTIVFVHFSPSQCVSLCVKEKE